jgi:hypothetical protein
MYILAATFTVLAAISFAGKTILSFSQVVNQNKVQIEDVSDQIVENKEQIKILKRLQIKYINASDSYEIKIQNDTNKLGTVDYNNIRNTKDIKKQIDIIMNSNTVLVSKYNAMLTNKSINQDSESDDSFQFYSDILKINKRWIIFVILLLFFVSIEYGFFVSAPKEDTDNDFLINNKDELFKYIDYLTDVTDIEKKLQSDKVISKLMGIDVNKCTYYRKILGGEDPDLSITFRDATNKKEPMIANKKGFSFANTTKENMKQIITNKIKLS